MGRGGVAVRSGEEGALGARAGLQVVAEEALDEVAQSHPLPRGHVDLLAGQHSGGGLEHIQGQGADPSAAGARLRGASGAQAPAGAGREVRPGPTGGPNRGCVPSTGGAAPQRWRQSVPTQELELEAHPDLIRGHASLGQEVESGRERVEQRGLRHPRSRAQGAEFEQGDRGGVPLEVLEDPLASHQHAAALQSVQPAGARRLPAELQLVEVVEHGVEARARSKGAPREHPQGPVPPGQDGEDERGLGEGMAFEDEGAVAEGRARAGHGWGRAVSYDPAAFWAPAPQT